MQAQYIGMFQAGWFVESMWSQTLVIHMIRTPKLSFIQSRASAPVTLLTMTGIAVLTVIPFTPFGAALGLVALPASYFAYLIPCILLYMMQATKMNWKELWRTLFETCEWLRFNMGFRRIKPKNK